MGIREGFDAEQERRCRERQLLLLGAALASKEVRSRVRPDEFADARLGEAFGDLGGRNGSTDLRCVLADVGLADWEPADGNPLDLLIEHVRLDGRLSLVWRDIAYAIENTNAVRALSVGEKSAALERAGKVIDEAHELMKGARRTPSKQGGNK